MKCPECGAQTCTHALDAMEDYAAHALAMEETVDSLRSRAEAAESERDAARAEVARLREAIQSLAQTWEQTANWLRDNGGGGSGAHARQLQARPARENTGAPDAAEGIAAEFEAKVKAAAEPIFATARAESYATGRREGHREGYMLAVDCAVGMVRYHCDCTHADVPGLVELLKDDPTFGYKGLDTLPPSVPSPGIGDQDKEDGRG